MKPDNRTECDSTVQTNVPDRQQQEIRELGFAIRLLVKVPGSDSPMPLQNVFRSTKVFLAEICDVDIEKRIDRSNANLDHRVGTPRSTVSGNYTREG